MIKPIYIHHNKQHKFVGHIVHESLLHDIYVSDCNDYGKTLWARFGNNELEYKTMPVKFIGGGGMKDCVLTPAKDLYLAIEKKLTIETT
jgi:hypothetical protein